MQSYEYIENSFCGKASIDIYYQGWIAKNPKAILIIVHGIGEHSGRYKNIVDAFKNKNISIYAFDLRGHGKSGGKRGHVTSFIDYVYDLKLFINLIKEKNPEKPVFLFGHSFGGVVASRFALTYKEDLKALLLSAPAFRKKEKIKGIKKVFASFMACVMPSFGFKNGINAELLSHDKNVVKNYLNDELNHDKVSARWFFEYQYNSEYCLERADEIRMPVLILHGGADKIIDIKGSQIFIERINSKDKTLEIFEDQYHEIINEKKADKDAALNLMLKWIIDLISGKKKLTRKTGNKKVSKKVTQKKIAKKTVKKKSVAKKSVKSKKVVKKTTKKKVAKKKSVKKTTKK